MREYEAFLPEERISNSWGPEQQTVYRSLKSVDQVLDYILIPPNPDTEYNFVQELDAELTKPGIKADLICMRRKKIVD